MVTIEKWDVLICLFTANKYEIVVESNQQQFDVIRKVLPSKESAFTCSGHACTTEPVTIHYETKDKKIGLAKIPMTDDQLKELIDACDVATFGMGQQEVTDETYRKALKLDKNLFSTSLQLCETDILSTIRKILMPQA